jgi:nitroimidazol reductase NimA-like FMN-containing flavoprotein (pyridoxamine 5'-phosphate oxidase superfamily)
MKSDDRTKVNRVPKRGVYDLDQIRSTLDSHFLCHIGFIYEGYPVVIPTLYGCKNDQLYIHGATSSRLLKTLQKGPEVSVAVTLVDGIVLARSAFHHSMNYRSVVLFGKAEPVQEDQKKLEALKVISEQVVPGRWEEVRSPNAKELKATTVLSIPIKEVSAKVRTGPPVDEKDDYKLDVWAGILPMNQEYGEPVPDPLLKENISLDLSILRLTGKNEDSQE